MVPAQPTATAEAAPAEPLGAPPAPTEPALQLELPLTVLAEH